LTTVFAGNRDFWDP